MAPQPNERSRPGAAGTAPDDLLAGGIETNHIANSPSADEGAVETVVGLLLTSPTVEVTLALLDGLPAPIPDPVLAWWLTGIRLSAEAGVRPNPWTALDRANRAGIEQPPALRGLPLAAGWELVGRVSTVPMAVAAELVRIVRDGHVRRTAEIANERLAVANWRGELVDLAEVWQREAAAVLAMLAEAVDEHA